MTDLQSLTILIGPQSRLALSLNAVVRMHRAKLARAGLNAFPNRVGTPLLRRCLDPERVDGAGAERLEEVVGPGPAFLSAINIMGPPRTGLHRGELFPDVEALLSRLDSLGRSMRIVFCPDSLPDFFLAGQSDALEARVRRHDWEQLYELSWAELARETIAASPSSEFLVLTPSGTAINSPQALAMLFGPAAELLPDPYVLLKDAVSETGCAVLTRMQEAGAPEEITLSELYTSFSDRASEEVIAERLGLDKLTVTLLEQRFAEDLAAIAALPGVEIL